MSIFSWLNCVSSKDKVLTEGNIKNLQKGDICKGGTNLKPTGPPHQEAQKAKEKEIA